MSTEEESWFDVVCPGCGSRFPVPENAFTEFCPDCGGEVDTAANVAPEASRGAGGRIGDYEILGKLGGGATGTVYKARHVTSREEVALKVLHAAAGFDEEARQRFQREARIVARLDHANIVRVSDFGQCDTQPWFAMELLRRQPLDDFAEKRQLDVREIVELMVTVCRAVDHAHRQGVIHRDLKPENILVDDADQPRIVDFGSSKMVDLHGTLDGRVMLTQEGRLFGTLAYMSPEQAAGRANDIDGRTDVYSLGVILYQLVTHHLPFKTRATVSRVLSDIQTKAPTPPRAVSKLVDERLERVILRCIEKPKESRYGSAGELARDLENYLAERPLLARRAYGRRALRLAGAALVVVLLASAGVITYRRLQRRDAENVAERNAGATGSVEAEANARHRELKDRKEELADRIGARRWAAALIPQVMARMKRTEAQIARLEREGRIEAAIQAADEAIGVMEALEPPVRISDRQRSWAESRGLEAVRTIALGDQNLRMVLIPPGRFEMGSRLAEEEAKERFFYTAGGFAAERPRHSVRITRPFYMSVCCVTNGQFRQFRPGHDSGKDGEVSLEGARRPAVGVSWEDAVTFCRWLSERQGKRFRLPTEAQWEYACRAGSSTLFWWGETDSLAGTYGNVADKRAWQQWRTLRIFNVDDGYTGSAPVGAFRPNELGLYDMAGNVWEWCGDWYSSDYYSRSAEAEPPGPETGVFRVLRGGSYRSGPADCRCAARWFAKPTERLKEAGFRLVMAVE